jgi:hypothetical protein
MNNPMYKKSTLLILIDPFVHPDIDRDEFNNVTHNRYAKEVFNYVKDRTNNVKYFFLAVYDSPTFLKNEKWCGKTSKRKSLENRVFTYKLEEYGPAKNFSHTYCPSLESAFDDLNKQNVLATSAFFTQDLKDFLDTYPDIKNVIISGEAWQQCIKFRPLGIYNVVQLLKKYKKINLLIDSNLIGGMSSTGIVLNEDKTSILGEPCWENVGGSLFYLPKEKYDLYLEKDIYSDYSEYTVTLETDDFHIIKGENIDLFLNDSVSAKHITLDLFDKVSNFDF